MKKRILIFVCGLLIAESVFSQELRKEIDADYYYDYNVLCNADEFHAISASPYDESGFFKESLAFFRLLRRPNCVSIFRQLVSNAKTNEGKMYGLVGLYFCNDNDNYFKESTKLKDHIVEISFADVSWEQSVSEVLEILESGDLIDSMLWHVDLGTLTIRNSE